MWQAVNKQMGDWKQEESQKKRAFPMVMKIK